METTEASKIELILGDAVRLLVESGASSSIVGPFALKFGAKVAQRLAVAEPAHEKPMLANLLDPANQQLRAIIQASVDHSIANSVLAAQTQAPGRVRIKVGAGDAVTSVSLPEPLLAMATQKYGSVKAANSAIRQLYDTIPADAGNKSRVLAHLLTQMLQNQPSFDEN